MKTVFNINKFLVIATSILYLTIYLGLYAQILLGAVQLLSALGILFLWKHYNNKQQKHIILYWILTLCYGLGWLIVKDLNGDGKDDFLMKFSRLDGEDKAKQFKVLFSQ